MILAGNSLTRKPKWLTKICHVGGNFKNLLEDHFIIYQVGNKQRFLQY